MNNLKNIKLLYCILGSFILTLLQTPILFQATYTVFGGSSGSNLFTELLYTIFGFISFIGVILLIVFRKKIKFDKLNLRNACIYLGLFILSIGIYIGNIFIQDREVGSAYNLYFESNNVSLNISRLGVPAATFLDIYRCIFGIDEKIIIIENEELDSSVVDNENVQVEVQYDYNIMDIVD